ncbi:MAG: DedA family protein [Rhizobiaceae bacterium]
MDTLHQFIESYGLIAVFIGCIAEGESATILAGFFAHQHVFVPWQAFVAVFAGAFLGDVAFFLTGRLFADNPLVIRLKARPGFDRAFELVREHPAKYVVLNRYVYGFRLVGGVAAGLSDIPGPKFVALNVLSSLIWASIFTAIGWFFGLGAERLIGDALKNHHRIVIGLGIGLTMAVIGGLLAHHLARRDRGGHAGAGNQPDRPSP